jgi:hypothetical protein
MHITDILAHMGGLQSMASELGISEHQAARGAEALAPAILGGGGLLDAVLSPQPTDVGRGNDVLGQIFGSKDVSRAVAQNAAAQSGLHAGVLRKMLPLLAMLVTGYLSRQGGAAAPSPAAAPGGGLGDLLGGLLGGSRPRRRPGPRLDAGPRRRRQSAGRHPASRRRHARLAVERETGRRHASVRSGPNVSRCRARAAARR